MYDELLAEITAMNGNAKALLEKYDNAGVKLDTKTNELLQAIADAGNNGLNAIQQLLDSGNVAQAENSLKLDGKTLEEIIILNLKGVLQVKTAEFQGVGSTSLSSGTNPTVETGLELFNIPFTPKSKDSKIFIMVDTVSIHEEINDGNIVWLGSFIDEEKIKIKSGNVNYSSFSNGLNSAYLNLNHNIDSWGETLKNLSIRAGIDDGTAYINGNTYYNFSEEDTTINLTIMEIL